MGRRYGDEPLQSGNEPGALLLPIMLRGNPYNPFGRETIALL